MKRKECAICKKDLTGNEKVWRMGMCAECLRKAEKEKKNK